MTRLCTIVLASAGVAGVGVGAIASGTATAAQARGFQAPSGNIACVVASNVLRCDIAQTNAKPPPKPAACDFDWGESLSITPRGRARWACVSDTVLRGGFPTVGYGKTFRSGGFTCGVQRVGIQCENLAGKGFFLARERVTLLK